MRLILMVFIFEILNQKDILAENTKFSGPTKTASVDATNSSQAASNKVTTNESLDEVVVTDIQDFAALGNKAYDDGLYDMGGKDVLQILGKSE